MISTLFTDPSGTELQVYFSHQDKLIIKLTDNPIDNIITYELDRDDLVALISELEAKLNTIDNF